TVHAIAASIAPIQGVTLTLDGQAVALDASGTAHITAGQPGKIALVATATDADAVVGTTTAVLKVRDSNDLAPPVVALDPSLSRSPLATVTDVIGTVADSNLDVWTLEQAPLGSDNFVRIAG